MILHLEELQLLFAMTADIIMAEPKALIGFAGPRVIRETIGRDLPEGFRPQNSYRKKDS